MRRMRFLPLLFLFAISISSSSLLFGQKKNSSSWFKYRHEIAVGTGFNTLLANFGEDDQFGLDFMLQRSTFNANYRFYITKNMVARASVTQAYCRKNDKDLTITNRMNFPIDYKTSLSEFAALFEYHLIHETTLGRKKGPVRRARGGMSKSMNIGISFYTGPALTYFRPIGEFQGSRVILVPVKPGFNPGYDTDVPSYKRVHLHIPLGTNVRFIVNESVRFGVDLGYRFGLKPYLDNVSAVYYRDGKPDIYYSTLPDPNWTEGYVTFTKGNGETINNLVSAKGRSNYFIGMVTFAYRLRSR